MSELAPPDSGSNVLAPIQDGWPLRTVTGNAVWKLVPPQARPLARVLTVLPATLFVGGLVGMTLWTGGSLYLWWIIGKGGVTKLGFLAAGAAGLARLSARLVRWQLRRLASLHVSLASLRGSPPGSLVRVVGTVRAEAAFAAAVSGEPAVMTRYEVRPASGPASHQLRGVDFYLDLEGAGESVRVSVKDAYFDDRHALESNTPANFGVVGSGSCDTRYREARLAPGDRIEAVGVLVREVDPQITGGPGRAPGLRQVIRASPHLPLLLRKLPAQAAR
jgi:hypothetical protein